MDKTQEKKSNEIRKAQNPYSGRGQEQKENKNIKEAPSVEDWEGGGSRPQSEENSAGARGEGKEKSFYPRPVEAGEKKHDKNLESDAQRRQKGDVC